MTVRYYKVVAVVVLSVGACVRARVVPIRSCRSRLARAAFAKSTLVLGGGKSAGRPAARVRHDSTHLCMNRWGCPSPREHSEHISCALLVPVHPRGPHRQDIPSLDPSLTPTGGIQPRGPSPITTISLGFRYLHFYFFTRFLCYFSLHLIASLPLSIHD